MICRSTLFFMALADRSAAVVSLQDVVEYVHDDLINRCYHVGPFQSNEHRSCISWDHANKRGVVNIDPRASSEAHPHDAVWDLLHEWGHSIAEPPPIGYKCMQSDTSANRELEAWNVGWSHASNQFSKLLPYELDYRRRQEECLSTYLPDPPVTAGTQKADPFQQS